MTAPRIFGSTAAAAQTPLQRLAGAGWEDDEIAWILAIPDPFAPEHILWLGEAPLEEIREWAVEFALWQCAMRVAGRNGGR